MTCTPEGQADAGAFDVEAAISAFLADPNAKSLELPHMAADQRKKARSLVDQHSELKCESYGFGAERQLHLFKRSSSKATGAAAGVRVKNTFIDDWISAGGNGAESEAPMFRSMPMGLQGCLLQDGSSQAAAPAAAPAERAALDASPSCSTTASVAASSPSPLTQMEASVAVESVSVASSTTPGSPQQSSRMPVDLPEGVEVRNTFIHIDSPPADDRVVQSMPHGMFRQCLWEEAKEKARASVASAAPPDEEALVPPAVADVLPPPPAAPAMAQAASALSPVDLVGSQILACGTEVMIEGLTKFPAFNGLVGFVQSLDEATGRYNILLSVPAGPGGHQWAKVKAENLKTTLPPPPTGFAAAPMPMPEDFQYVKSR